MLGKIPDTRKISERPPKREIKTIYTGDPALQYEVSLPAVEHRFDRLPDGMTLYIALDVMDAVRPAEFECLLAERLDPYADTVELPTSSRLPHDRVVYVRETSRTRE
ncbi:MAG TPA: hypothetical protein PK765_06290 [bacterium]|nr:hypothetical protein [bacterium]